VNKPSYKKKVIEDHFMRRSEKEIEEKHGKKKVIESHHQRESHQFDNK
jgi:hypothetical protein